MGYPMARNLRLKIPVDDKLVIFDVDHGASKRFAEELGSTGGGVVVASDVAELANQSVCFFSSSSSSSSLQSAHISHDEYVSRNEHSKSVTSF